MPRTGSIEFVTRLLVITMLVGLMLESPIGSSENPAAAGFNTAASDAQAIEIADQVMANLGGRQAWDETRFITWSFFGRRRHVWDKFTGDLRVEGVDRETEKPYLILMNLYSKKGRAWSNDEEITDPPALEKMLDRGEAVWINDGYWMFMPFKLKDSGVTLKYVGEKEMLDGRMADTLQLTFENVGRTPENKYLVYVAKDTGLVEQWDFFSKADDPEPRFQSPWHNWQPHGAILLSDNRGDGGHTDIAVFTELPSAIFSDPAEVDWSRWLAGQEPPE